MKYLKIYEAGKMSGLTFSQMNDWRVELKDKLLNIAEDVGYKLLVVNPVDFYNFEEQRHQSEEEIEDYDLAHVLSSNIIVVNLDGLSTSDGTKFELHDGNYNHRIPVIAFGNKKLYDNLHPWIKRDITRVEQCIDDVVQYIKDFYMI